MNRICPNCTLGHIDEDGVCDTCHEHADGDALFAAIGLSLFVVLALVCFLVTR